MQVRVLGCSGGCAPGCDPSCYLLGNGVAIDAGALAASLTIEEQRAVTDVFLTHAHWDHVRDLPLTVINRDATCPTLIVHGLPETVGAIRTHLMNDIVWFSAFDLPSEESPFIASRAIQVGEVRECNGYKFMPFAVPHTVPAISYLVDDGEVSVILCADTGGGGIFNHLPGPHSPLRAVFLEASFPNRMKDFAVMTGHLTPEMLGAECVVLPADCEIIVTHMKPGFEGEIEAELAALGRPGLRAARQGETIEFTL